MKNIHLNYTNYYSYNFTFPTFQILHFMRIDRKATARGQSTAKPCISFVIRDLCDALCTKGIEIDPNHFLKGIQHLPINTTNPQWFLKAGSDLDYIPCTKSRLSIHGHQRKCCQIHKSVFPEELLCALDEGTCAILVSFKLPYVCTSTLMHIENG